MCMFNYEYELSVYNTTLYTQCAKLHIFCQLNKQKSCFFIFLFYIALSNTQQSNTQ